MNKTGSYQTELINISPKKWEDFLKKHSSLPGPRANIELAKAFVQVGTLMDFKKYVELGPEEAPENTPDEFLTFCGVLGFGNYLAKNHDSGLLGQLRKRANDPRWRVREAVVMALQTVGRKNMSRLMKYAGLWSEGTFMEQRAAIAALCEPDLLTDQEVRMEVLDLLDWVTATMIEHDDQKDEGYKVLQKGLSYCWSVAVTASPQKGKSKMERWMKEIHPIINQIMKENLKKKRLQKLDPEWVGYWVEKLKKNKAK